MSRLNIAAKIWLRVGVFILGYALYTGLTQIQARQARVSLRTTSQALFPATQRSQEAESGFQRMVKGFGDAVILQDVSGLDRAAEDGQQAVSALRATSSLPLSMPAGPRRPPNWPPPSSSCSRTRKAPMAR
jgi:hypothetical protein